MFRLTSLLAMLVVLTGFAAAVKSVPATEVAIQLTGEVTLVSDIYGILSDNGITVNVGDTISATYRYETTTPDTNPLGTVGDYSHSTSPFGFSTATAGGLAMGTDPSSVDFLVEIVNDHGSPTPRDNYLLRSYTNIHNLPVTLEMTHISWQLDDSTLTALDSTDLPLLPPNLDDFDQESGFDMSGEGGMLEFFLVRGVITSATLIPEPTTFLMSYLYPRNSFRVYTFARI